MGNKPSTVWQRVATERYNAIADGKAGIAHFLNVLLLYLEKKATVEQILLERDRLLVDVPRPVFENILYRLQLAKKIENTLLS